MNKECVVGQVVMVALWKIWLTRNTVIFKVASPDPCIVAQEICDAIEETNDMLGKSQNLALLLETFCKLGLPGLYSLTRDVSLMVRLCLVVSLRT